jgi:hypothetical protein
MSKTGEMGLKGQPVFKAPKAIPIFDATIVAIGRSLS